MSNRDSETEQRLATLQIHGLGSEFKLFVHESIETASSRMLELGKSEQLKARYLQLKLRSTDVPTSFV